MKIRLYLGVFLLPSLLLPLRGTTQLVGQSKSTITKRSLVDVLRVGQIVSLKTDTIIIEADSEKLSDKYAQKWVDVYKVVEIGQDYVALRNHVYDRYVNSNAIRQIVRKRSLPTSDSPDKVSTIDSRKEQMKLIQSVAKQMVEMNKVEKDLQKLRGEMATLRKNIKVLQSALEQDTVRYVFNGVEYTDKQVRDDLAKRVNALGEKEDLEQEWIGFQKSLQKSIKVQELKLKELTLPNLK